MFIVYTILFYFLHSFLVLESVKSKIVQYISQQQFRLIYNLISVTLFTLVIIEYLITKKSYLFSHPWSQKIGSFIAFSGFVVCSYGFSYNLKSFLGFKKEEEKTPLVTSGLQAKVRHPLYLGTLIVFIGIFFITPTLNYLVFFFFTILYLVIGIRLEEKKLINIYGEEYKKYKESTPAIFPFK